MTYNNFSIKNNQLYKLQKISLSDHFDNISKKSLEHD